VSTLRRNEAPWMSDRKAATSGRQPIDRWAGQRDSGAVGIDEVIEQYHLACDAFATGDPEPIKALCTRSDDSLLANPFGGFSRGWDEVSRALDFASSNFRDGLPVRFEEVTRYAGADLVVLFEHEQWETKVGGRDELSPWELRVTTTFRAGTDGWRWLSRHADPLMTPHQDGPIRPSR
jgi:hypothetical protein